MKFKSIASSSKGNAYLVTSKGLPPLLIEAGISFKKLREAVNYDLSGLAGCLVSHSHSDHNKAVPLLIANGVDCFMSKGTAEEMGIQDHYRIVKLYTTHDLQISGWIVKSFDLIHDTKNPFGFLIGAGKESLLFVPDTGYIVPHFGGVTIAAVECNHNADILHKKNTSAGARKRLGQRVRRNHMSLDTLIEFLKANNLSQCREIHLLHMSDQNADEEAMIRKVQEATGIPTYACEG